jgi:hypothetical protein
MKATPDSRRGRHVTSISLLVLMMAFIAMTVNCTEPARYDLTVSATEGGEVTSPNQGTTSYYGGKVIDLVAKPDDGCRFVNWTGDVDAIDDVNAASTTITMNGTCSITANFMAQYVLTTDSTDGGKVTMPGEGVSTYDAGTVVNLTAEANQGFKFLSWTGDVAKLGNVTAPSTAIAMEADSAITADFIAASVYLDDIGPGLWDLAVWGQGVNATVTPGGVVVNISSGPANDPQAEPEPAFGGGASSTYHLKGDFDTRLTYELAIWPQRSGVRVGISVDVPSFPDKFVGVTRVGFGHNDDFPSGPREVYLADYEGSIAEIAGTDDLSGTLGICRKGTTVSCYYGTPNDWQEVYKAEWCTDDVRISFSTWSQQCVFGDGEVTVLMRTVEIIEPPA